MKSSMRYLLCIVLGLCVVSCYSTPIYAWGRSGHRIVAMIAERNISPATQMGIKKILGRNVRLADVANYAEDVRNRFPRTFKFHFVDIPLNDHNYKPNRDCKIDAEKGDCVLAALPRFRNQVLSANSTPSQRAFALKFIIHLVGDVNQPLHCTENNGDFGGTRLFVNWFGDRTNLHKVWDTQIIAEADLTDDEFVEEITSDLNAEEIHKMRNGNILQWVLESHQLARAYAYKIPARAELGKDYYDENSPIVDKQLLRGGLRLARVLDWLFAPRTGSNSADPFTLEAAPVSQEALSSTSTPPDRTAVARDAGALRVSVEEVNNILSRGETLPRVGGVSTTGAFIEGFDADAVISIVKEGKETLNANLGRRKEFGGLQDYVSTFYQVPTYDSLERVGKMKDGRTLITPGSKAAAFLNPRAILRRILGLANENRLAVDLRINSQPEDLATYEMWSAGGERRSTATNNTIDGVYRGYYKYRIIKPGFKTIEDEINLVDSDGHILDCTMNKKTDSDGPHPCKHH